MLIPGSVSTAPAATVLGQSDNPSARLTRSESIIGFSIIGFSTKADHRAHRFGGPALGRFRGSCIGLLLIWSNRRPTGTSVQPTRRRRTKRALAPRASTRLAQANSSHVAVDDAGASRTTECRGSAVGPAGCAAAAGGSAIGATL